MANNRKGTYFDGKNRISCHIKQVRNKKARIVLNDGTEKLVESKALTIEGGINNDAPERMIPNVPLEVFYRSLRELKGTKPGKFQILHNLLNNRHGPKGAEFLAELFRRSVRHSGFYSNIQEGFYGTRKRRNTEKHKFANDLVEKLQKNKVIRVGSHKLEYVEYEIYPFRTTQGCVENGKAATHAGSGGLDLLLASDLNGILPGIGEIKAGSENVGPTFALVQSLMYASQMATHNQFGRLKKYYPGIFDSIEVDQPRVDVIVLLEMDQRLHPQDLQYALLLADDVSTLLSSHIRKIQFLSCSIKDDAVQCEVIKGE